MHPRLPLLVTLSSLAAVAGPPAPGRDLLTTEVVETVPLSVRDATVTVDPWSSEVSVRSSWGPWALAKDLSRARSTLCPRLERKDPRMVLHCTGSRLDAEVKQVGHRLVLELKAIRGLPFRDGEGHALRFLFAPEQVGLGGACPGTTAEGRAECALKEGRHADAEAQLVAASRTGLRPYVALRLGDLALARQHDVAGALAWYQLGVGPTPFGRLAKARVCELTGQCFDAEGNGQAFEGRGLPEPMRTELELREVRGLALFGQGGRAARALVARVDAPHRSDACAAWSSLCFAVSRLALDETDTPEVQSDGLELLARALRASPQGQYALARRGAEVASALGRPRLGARLLAAALPEVPKAKLQTQLARLSELYMQAGDSARAEQVLAAGATPDLRALADALAVLPEGSSTAQVAQR